MFSNQSSFQVTPIRPVAGTKLQNGKKEDRKNNSQSYLSKFEEESDKYEHVEYSPSVTYDSQGRLQRRNYGSSFKKYLDDALDEVFQHRNLSNGFQENKIVDNTFEDDFSEDNFQKDKDVRFTLPIVPPYGSSKSYSGFINENT